MHGVEIIQISKTAATEGQKTTPIIFSFFPPQWYDIEIREQIFLHETQLQAFLSSPFDLSKGLKYYLLFTLGT